MELTVDGLREFFSFYGEVVDCVIMSDQETKKSRCFGFVQFTTCQAVEDVMKGYFNVVINGKWVECKKALPKETCSELLKNQPQQQNAQLEEERAQKQISSLPMPDDLYKFEESDLGLKIEGSDFYKPLKNDDIYQNTLYLQVSVKNSILITNLASF